MNKLIIKNVSFQWTDICNKVFHFLKKAIINASVLRHFDRIKKIILKTDTFDYVNDKVLSQYDDEKVFFFVIFFSKNMISAKCNYEIYVIFISNRLKIRAIKINLNLSLYSRVMKVNKINDECFEYRIALTQKKSSKKSN